MRPLNFRQRLFVEHFLGEAEGSAADAARRAGYRCPEAQGPRLIKKTAIHAAIEARVATSALAADEVLARIADVASADLIDFIDVSSQGCKVDLKLIKRRGLGHLIRRVRIKKDGTADIELEAKLPALVKLGEYYKLWKGEAEQQITMVDVAKELEARYEKLRKDKEI
jgi:Terminase small subunit